MRRPAAPLLLALLALPSGARAQAAPPPLSFLGIQAGASLQVIALQLDSLGGGRIRCDRARRDPAVQECRGTLTDPHSGKPVEVWLSAMDSAAGILTLSSRLSGVDLDQWREALERRFGPTDARVQGTQWMLQWVRQGRMLRLTWKIEGTDKLASVSLVDGRVLDGWGRRRRESEAAPHPTAGTGER